MPPNDKPNPLPKSAIKERIQRIRKALGLLDRQSDSHVPVRAFQPKPQSK